MFLDHKNDVLLIIIIIMIISIPDLYSFTDDLMIKKLSKKTINRVNLYHAFS